jgi:hypothetical protein
VDNLSNWNGFHECPSVTNGEAAEGREYEAEQQLARSVSFWNNKDKRFDAIPVNQT